ncbi:hypothetical protein SAMN04487911_11267 [Arenibacter nanhaiticus]|uniref:Uncharacterized protein n=2 Tax=Arenibacter nanhaiticus TaxID=558155 RepID=A0A1M6GZY9_9FLAO|nr:hypothetical protein SAMN04487911_11267 [Arenibacter nanhaiticus]
MPCADEFQAASDSVVENIVDATHNHEHNEIADVCSPFCHCHCCHVNSIDFGITSFEPISAVIPSKIYIHFDSLGEEVIHSILQPPKV